MNNRWFILAGLVGALALAAFVAPFAASSPDGLERVAEDHGIKAVDQAAWTGAPLPDYQTPGVAHAGLATGTAGIMGTLVVFIAALGAGRLLQRPRQRRSPADG